MVLYLTPEQVIQLHDEEACEGTDLPGVDLGKLEPAVLRCQSAVFGAEQFPTIHEKAAALMIGIARAHAFVSANKRTSLLATHVFYLINGYELVVTPEDSVGLVLAIAQNYENDTAAVADRLSGWAQPLKFDGVEDSEP